MICELCASMGRARLPRTSGELRRLPNERAECQCCGRAMPAGMRSRFVALVSRLARFGLTGQPILKAADGRR